MSCEVPSASSTVAATENIYLPKLAVLDRVSDDIAEVKTFYWHFEDAAEQAQFKRFRPGQFAQVSLFGIGEFQKVMFIFVACVAFVVMDAATAVADVSDRYIDTACTLGANRRQIVVKVLVPLAMPAQAPDGAP